MLIDWFTVSAQAVNFIILVYLLKRFLYGPIMKAIDDRENRISSSLARAEAKLQEAEQTAAAVAKEKDEFGDQRRKMLEKAKEDASRLGKELKEEVKKEAIAARNKWQDLLNQEKTRFLLDVKRKAGSTIVKTLERILKEMAGEELEGLILERFFERLGAMPSDQKKKIEEHIAQGSAVTVRLSAAMPEHLRQRVQEFLQNYFLGSRNFVFEKSEALVAGIELISQDHKVSFCIADYLEQLQNELDAIVTQKEHANGQ